MKKVLILTLFFPPCNLTASQRAYSWAKYLHKFNYYPIIITRRWDHHLSNLKDVSKSTGTSIVYEKHEEYEVYYVPYKSNLRDKIYVKYGNEKFVYLRKALTLFELIFQNFTNFVIPYNNIYKVSRDIFSTNSDVNRMIVTGNPFNLYRFAYLLNKEFGAKWIADYRDAWTTSDINIPKGFFQKLIYRFDKFYEKKWVSTASFVTASSKPIADAISKFVGVKGKEIYNGFVSSDFDNLNYVAKFESYTITYIGTLYDGQKIEIFCEAYKKFLSSSIGSKKNIKLLFPGLSFYSKQEDRVKSILKGFEEFFECTQRIDRNKVLEIEKRSHLLLHVAWNEQKGIIASKIYEYIASGTKVLVVPTDNSSIEEIVNKSNAGTCLSNEDEVVLFLENEYLDYCNNQIKSNNVNSPEILQFSREEQVYEISKILDSI